MKKLNKIQYCVLLILGFSSLFTQAQNMQVSGGFLHTIVVCASGQVYHAGDRGDNQMGNAWNGAANSLVLTAVPGVGGAGTLTNIKMADAGSTKHTIALTNGGEVFAFGNDYACQLGQGGTSGSYPSYVSPVKGVGGIGSLNGIQYIAASSESSYAIRSSDGALISWGSNSVGQLGIGSVSGTPQGDPVLVNAPCNSGVIQVDGGDNFALALKSDGTVYGWGENNNGQLGIGSTTDQSSPQQVMIGPGVPLTGIVSISCGDGSSYAIKNDGTMYVWGHNGWGQLGIGNCNPINTYAVQAVTGTQLDASGFLQNVRQVVGGNAHAVVVLNDGTVYTMGSDQNGQLGDGAVGGADVCGLGIGCKNAPYRVTSLSNISSVSEGDHWSFAVDAAGQVYSWGQNHEGQLGIGFSGAGVPNPTAMTMPVGCVVLPIELLSFKVTLSENNNASLNWSTASEINSQQFEIERSTDGLNFFKIGTVAAAGLSSTILNYTYYDKDISYYGTVLYYRLKMIDIDQSYDYSKIEVVNLSDDEVIIYPVPVTSGETIHVIFAGDSDEMVIIQLSDIVGQVLVEKEVLTGQTAGNIQVSLPVLSPGVYNLRMILKNKIKDRKIIIH